MSRDPDDAHGLLTPREVAAALGVTPRTVQRWVAEGRLPATRVGGRVRVARSSLAEVAPLATTRGAAQREGEPDTRPIRSLLIANRGEIVLRIARTARRLGIRTIGVHLADERPPDGVDEARIVGSYLDAVSLIAAAQATGATAVHPGYGFLAERAEFAAAVEAAGLTWIGPGPGAMAAMGDKAAARRRASALGVPTLPGYDGVAQDEATLAREAARVGFPLLVKPSAGGGGKGMRVVREPSRLPDAIDAARREAQRAFGDDRLILERYLTGPRHVEIQVLFDAHGAGIHLGERDCSTQRRNQKVVEESPAPAVSADLRARMGAAALRLAADVGYRGAGTVEFLLADSGEFFFLEMNTRLQVEHPVTELVTGRDLVEDQLRIAEGHPLGIRQDEVAWRGHAIEARLYAEDPEAGFLPATGTLAALRWPTGPGIRVDAGVAVGDRVSDRFDPMLAKIVAHGANRDEALARLREALAETMVLGVRSNVRFLRWLLAQTVMERAEVRTDTLAGLPIPAPPTVGEPTLQAAAVLLVAGSPQAGSPWGGGWRANAAAAVWLASAGNAWRVAVSPPGGDGPAAAILDGTAFVDVEGQSVEITVAAPPSIEEAVRHAGAGEGHAILTAPMPGRVVGVRAREGSAVAAHAPVVVLEAMKMEHAVTSPMAGTVTRIAVSEGDQVQRGDLLAEVTA